MADRVSRDDVVAFRLGTHHLAERLDTGGLLDAVGACGVQDTPPGSALLALHARVADLTPGRVEAALGEDRTLLRTWCMRGAPFYVPTDHAAVFTTGVLPPDEKARLHLLPGVEPALVGLDMSLGEAVEATRAQIGAVLAGRRLAIGELGERIAERIARALPPERRADWEAPGPYAPGQPVGEAVVHFALRILTLQGVVCFATREGKAAPFVLVEEWLGHPIRPQAPDLARPTLRAESLGRPIPDVEAGLARAELLRRYLHCYGPSTPADFAAWLGVRPGDTEPWWGLLEEEMTAVEFRGTAWILTEDLDALGSTPMPTGVRLLPPHDPYTQARDRDTIVEERYHRQVWRTVGDPGTVLLDGAIAGIWRPRRRGRHLTVAVTTFDPLPEEDRERLGEAAGQVARLRGASGADVVVGTA